MEFTCDTPLIQQVSQMHETDLGLHCPDWNMANASAATKGTTICCLISSASSQNNSSAADHKYSSAAHQNLAQSEQTRTWCSYSTWVPFLGSFDWITGGLNNVCRIILNKTLNNRCAEWCWMIHWIMCAESCWIKHGITCVQMNAEKNTE